MATDSKDTIYIDVEDEITTIIDKVKASDKKLVALVLPKRASVFQSIVNMKLLKRKSDEAKKNLVIVTTETGLLPLAGAVGIHVAKNLSSKPEIPAAPIIDQSMVEAAEDESILALDGATGEGSIDLREAANEPIGKLAGDAEVPAAAAKGAKDIDTIELDDSEEKPTETAMPAAGPAKKSESKNGKLKVPNFERFRLLALLIGPGIVGLIVLFILMFKVFPHATIDIKTNAQNVNTNLTFNLSTSAKTLDSATDTVPAKEVTENKTYTATVNATGQQNNGQEASGSVNMTADVCSSAAPGSVPSGTEVVQSNLSYITQSATNFPALPTGRSGSCFVYYDSQTTGITAQNAGTAYNAPSNTNFTVPGYSDVTANGSASGGTNNIVTIVSAQDISNAENKITTDSPGAKSDLTSQLTQANYYSLDVTFTAGSPTTTPNASAGTAASSVTVSETVGYTMYGLIQSDLNTLLNSAVLAQAGANQHILSNGLASATYSIGSSPTNLSLDASAVVGPTINVTQLKKEVSGQKIGQIEDLIKTNPNVSSVTVNLSPFYVSKAPSPSKITINIAKPTSSSSNGN